MTSALEDERFAVRRVALGCVVLAALFLLGHDLVLRRRFRGVHRRLVMESK